MMSGEVKQIYPERKSMGNTSFKPSEFDKQAAASLDMMDVEVAQERVQAILSKQAGPTLTPAPQTQPQAPTLRKKRSDAGIPKGPKTYPTTVPSITLVLAVDEAQKLATSLRNDDPAMSAAIFNQIIAQLQRRLDQLQKAPK